MRVAIVVHGRFHAFDMARALLAKGIETTVFTNYPTRITARFGLPAERVVNCVWHGLAVRLLQKISRRNRPMPLEAWAHQSFSRWAARRVALAEFDVVHSFSGVAEELWQALGNRAVLKSLVRGSAHIETQFEILAEEERLSGVPVEKPSRWMRARENREYELSDQIVVLSGFARDSFLRRGMPPDKLALVPLGSELSKFRPEPAQAAARKARILAGEPLRVLTVGTWSRQKGVAYLAEVARQLAATHRFRFVGSIAPDARALALEARQWVEFRPRVPQYELPAEYAWGDIFLFPTLQDGYAVVLAQALTAGLPLLATTNCGAPELIVEGRTGWIVPIRDVAACVARLQWGHAQRAQLAAVLYEVARPHAGRDWSAVAADFLAQCRRRD